MPSSPATVGGGSPALIACAARTISDRAAWRKISVRRTVGTTPDSIGPRARGPARPARAGRRRRRAARACAAPTAPSSASARRTDEHRGLVDDQHVEARDRVLRARARSPRPARTRAAGGRCSPRRRSARRAAARPCRSARTGARCASGRAADRRARASSVSCPCPGRPVRIDRRCSTRSSPPATGRRSGTKAPLTGRS